MNIIVVGEKLLKIISDAKAAEQTPAVAQLIADLEDLYKTEIAPPVPPKAA